MNTMLSLFIGNAGVTILLLLFSMIISWRIYLLFRNRLSLVVGIIVGFITFSTASVLVNPMTMNFPKRLKNSLLGKPYYENPDYWDYRSHYWNDQLVKFDSPSTGKMVFFDDVAEVNWSTYSLEATFLGLKPIELEYKYKFLFHHQDSINYTYHADDISKKGTILYNEKGKIKSVIQTSSDTSEAISCKYIYDSEGKFTAYEEYEGEQLESRTIRKYINPFTFEDNTINNEGVIQESAKCTLDSVGRIQQEEIVGRDSAQQPLFNWSTIYYTYDKGKYEAHFVYPNDNTLDVSYDIGFKGWKQSRSSQKVDELKAKIEYDNHGNWIRSILYEDGIPTTLKLRQIKYQDGTVTGQLELDDTEAYITQ